MDELDKELMVFFDETVDVSEDYTTLRYNDGSIHPKKYKPYRERAVKEIKQKIATLYEKKLVEARIDELTKLHDYFYDERYKDNKISKRIAELKAQSQGITKLKGENNA